MNITKVQLIQALRKHKYIISHAASAIGVDESTIRRWIKKCNIDIEYEKTKMTTDVKIEQVKVVNSTKTTKIRKGTFVVIPDTHSWFCHMPAFKAVLQFIKDFKPEYVIQIGDLIDFACLRGKAQLKNLTFDGQDLAELTRDFNIGGDLLSAISTQVSANTKKYYLLGNHEYRTEEIMAKHPGFESILSIPQRLNTGDWVVKPYLEPLKLGKLNFFHGEYFNEAHIKKHLTHYQKNLIYGHTHAVAQGTLASPMREIPTWAGNVGCLCNTSPDYQRKKTNRWEHGFAYGWFDDESGNFYPYLVRIIKDEFIAEGKKYKG